MGKHRKISKNSFSNFFRRQNLHSLTFYVRSNGEIPSFQLDLESNGTFSTPFARNLWILQEKQRSPAARRPSKLREKARKIWENVVNLEKYFFKLFSASKFVFPNFLRAFEWRKYEIPTRPRKQ